MNASLWIAGVLAGFGTAVALSGAFVWIYNRLFFQMREVWFKKFLSLILLPIGCVAGLVVLLRFGLGDPPVGESAAWLAIAAVGWAITARYATIAAEKRRMTRGSTFARVRGLHIDAINWPGLPSWGRVALRVLRPINEAGRLRIHRRRVVVPGLATAFEGYRIVHLCDFHIHHSMRTEWYEAVVVEAMRLRGDLLLYGGDFISKPQHVPRIRAIFDKLSAPDGVWYVRGNHDFWKGGQRTARQARSAGMRLLSNEGIVLRRGGAQLTLLGIEAPYVSISPREREAMLRLPAPKLALVHTPDIFPEAAQFGCFLAIAGHTHGGQVRLPVFGTTLSSTAAGPLLASGIGRAGRMLTITSNGQGAFLPLRFLCPPEIVVIELVKG